MGAAAGTASGALCGSRTGPVLGGNARTDPPGLSSEDGSASLNRHIRAEGSALVGGRQDREGSVFSFGSGDGIPFGGKMDS